MYKILYYIVNIHSTDVKYYKLRIILFSNILVAVLITLNIKVFITKDIFIQLTKNIQILINIMYFVNILEY